jgi:cytochrome c biogenesis protein CcdA
MEAEMEQTSQFILDRPGANGRKPEEFQRSKGRIHACKASRRGYQQARDRLRRANRDLGETAAFIAASLTTVTAIQAVISIANDKLGLSREILQLAFNGYIAIFILILLLGAFRASNALHRRAQAEREIDQTKKGIFEFCSADEWPQAEE